MKYTSCLPVPLRVVSRVVLRAALPVALPVALSAALLAGCAGPGITPLRGGQPEAEVVKLWGAPTARYALPSGARLEYATGPAGRETWMVDLDDQGRALAWRQVLDWRNLERVQGDLTGMSREQLLRTLGRAGDVRSGGREGGQVWSWRFDSPFCLWFQASVSDAGRVTSAAFAPDPQCDGFDDQTP